MIFLFFNAADTPLFSRSDAEQATWTVEEFNLQCLFPYDAEKPIERGQRIGFKYDGVWQLFEIRKVKTYEPDHYQEITAEHIALAELTDEHINSTKLTGKTAAEALTTALTGTLWSVGTDTSSGTQNADFSRGSVWDAVNTIQSNWNVYITPRIVISSAGAITGRYLDIAPATGIWRGLRLSVRKNMVDPSVTYDDEGVFTALYGYGGNVGKAQQSGDDTKEELTFANEVWTATSSHPAKPAGQTYLEWPEKTALYGRNGRPRYGYYQNGSITDASVLLEKTWESLQASCNPKISIAGTCVDLYRLGYTDEPLRLHDQVVIEIEETGETFYKQIICCDIDLIDPSGSRVEIGDYIPNIIYINHDTAKKAGGGGGGRGRGSMDNAEDIEVKTFADLVRTDDMIGLVVGTKNGQNYIKGGEITLAINEDGGTTATLAADCIDMQGVVSAMEAYSLQVVDFNAADGEFTGELKVTGGPIIGYSYVQGTRGKFDDLDVDGTVASWKSYTARFCTLSTSHYYNYASSSGSITPAGTVTGRLVTGYTDTTIYYLGHT